MEDGLYLKEGILKPDLCSIPLPPPPKNTKQTKLSLGSASPSSSLPVSPVVFLFRPPGVFSSGKRAAISPASESVGPCVKSHSLKA